MRVGGVDWWGWVGLCCRLDGFGECGVGASEQWWKAGL